MIDDIRNDEVLKIKGLQGTGVEKTGELEKELFV